MIPIGPSPRNTWRVSVEAADVPGFDTLLVKDRAATTNPRFCHDATMLDIHQIFGFTLVSTDLAKAIAP